MELWPSREDKSGGKHYYWICFPSGGTLQVTEWGGAFQVQGLSKVIAEELNM